jgi:V/A-type H+-transporting ATPase subunit E
VDSLNPEDSLPLVILPRQIIGVEDLCKHPEELKEGSLAYFVVRQSKEMLSNGITFKVGIAAAGGGWIA